MSYIGTSKLGGMHLGNTKIAKAYLGSDLVYQGQTGPKVTTTTYTREVSGSGSVYIYRDFVVGATYDFDLTTDARAGGYVKINIQNNGESGNKWADQVTWSKEVTVQPSPSRMAVIFGSSSASGSFTLVVTETIP